MIWSWWPNVGFEPRYGGDIAAGAFRIANFLAYTAKLSITKSALETVHQGIRILEDSPNATLMYNDAAELLKNCTTDFEEGWYSIAVAKLNKAHRIIERLTIETKPFETIQRLKSLNQIETGAIVTLAIILASIMAHWLRRLVHTHGKV